MHTPRLVLCSWAAGTLLAASACDGCGGPKTVPFKQDAAAAPTAEVEDEPKRDAGPALSLQYDGGAAEPQVDESPIPAQSVHAVLAHDMDADGDRDALVIYQPGTDQLALALSVRGPDGFEPLRNLSDGSAPLPEGCALANATVGVLSPSKAMASAHIRCDRPTEAPEQRWWALSLGEPPRIVERFEVLPAGGRVDAKVNLAASAEDRDEDGHEDVLLEVSVQTPDMSAPATLPLVWLDRPSGLARDVREPNAHLQTLGAEAERALKRRDASALELARGVMALHAVICRESGKARLSLSGVSGVGCGRSKAAGTAAMVTALSLASRGELLQAIAAYDTLTAAGVVSTSAQRERVRKALGAMPGVPGLQLTTGPSLPPRRVRGERLPRVRFVDEARLWVDTSPPQLFDIQNAVLQPVPVPVAADPSAPPTSSGADSLLRDPSGRLAAAGIERTCDGYVVRIVDAQLAAAGGGRAVSKPLLAPQPAPGRCTSIPPGQRHENGGFRLLGWAPQGVLAARRDELRLVPLTMAGAPAGPARVLPATTPAPAPLPSGRATPDGRKYVEGSEQGVLVFSRGGKPDVQLWRSSDWDSLPGAVGDVAISPSGRQVAFVRGLRAYVLSKTP